MHQIQTISSKSDFHPIVSMYEVFFHCSLALVDMRLNEMPLVVVLSGHINRLVCIEYIGLWYTALIIANISSAYRCHIRGKQPFDSNIISILPI